jgi:hypothetical protein
MVDFSVDFGVEFPAADFAPPPAPLFKCPKPRKTAFPGKRKTSEIG